MNWTPLSSAANEKVKFAASLKQKKNRDLSHLFLIEGPKLIWEAFRCGLSIEMLFSEVEMDVAANQAFLVSEEIIQKISDAVTPQGAVAVAKMPEFSVPIRREGKYILLERIANPGNFGSIVRSAESFGFDGILTLASCADPFSPKAVRGSMGSLLRLPIYPFTTTEEAVAALREKGISLVAAELRKNALSPCELPKKGICIAIGNEGAGLSEELAKAADASVCIPMQGEAESLSAGIAAAILMWEVSKG